MARCRHCSSWFSLRPKGDGKCKSCLGSGREAMIQAISGMSGLTGSPRCMNCGGTGVCPNCCGSGEINREQKSRPD